MSAALPEFIARHNSHQKLPCCPACGKELVTFHEQRENICSDLKCRGPWLQRKNAHEQEKTRATQAALAEAALEQLRRTAPDAYQRTEAGELRLIVVPDFESELAPQSAERIAAFREMLEQLMSDALELVNDAFRVENLLCSYEPRDRDQSSLAIMNACGTCRGRCCRMGYQHAFITAEFLAWRLVHEPDADPAAMIGDYIDRIPAQSLNDSCLYHTTTGCALPRELRSGTCNDFLCIGFRPHMASLAENPDQPTVAAAYDGDGFVRFGTMDSDGNRTEITLDADEPPEPASA
ncbi:MAG: hypothetical protein R3C19_02555 [Planctomycetaceae bacterium]